MHHVENNQILLHLSLIEDIGPTTVGLLLTRMPAGYTLSDVYAFSDMQFVQFFGMSLVRARKIALGLSDRRLLEQELSYIKQHNVSWITILDDAYPPLLKAIIGPPVVIYYKGAPLSDSAKCLAVIGSRKANSYGKKFIDTVVPVLVKQGWVIVSGGALGADTMAHQAAVAAGGSTIVVLGSGLMHPYPVSNKRLFDAIVAQGGTIISAFAMNMQALPGNFPARNRIISGLSRGCIVAQAAKKSGASITAHYALDQGRDVFAVPGPLDDELSAGCHALIQQGAKLTTCAEDIVQEYGEIIVPRVDEQLMVYAESEPELRSSRVAVCSVSGIAGDIINACVRPLSVQELLERTGLSLPELNAVLFELQLSGHIEQDFAGQWKQV